MTWSQRPSESTGAWKRSVYHRFRLALACTNCPSGLARDIRRAIVSCVVAVREKQLPRLADLSVALVSDSEIADLNQRWLGHPGPTDVITFDLSHNPDATRLEGQIVISLDTARREARLRGHPWRHEILLYVVHAVLHLLGYDDRRPAERAAMHRLEDQILTKIGIGPVFRRREVSFQRGGKKKRRGPSVPRRA